MTGPALAELLRQLRLQRIEQLRLAWCDLHGNLRGKALVVGHDDAALAAVGSALAAGVGMVGTLLLKDSSDHTALPVFDPAARAAWAATPGLAALARLAGAGNVLLRPCADSFIALPWAPGTGWLRAQAGFDDGTPVPLDTRHVLQRALARLAQLDGVAGRGLGLHVGLELEFHIHRITDDGLAADAAGWPGEPPAVRHTHAGYALLGEACADLADEPLAIVRRTALGLGLPLRSLEIEIGPSQFEAVFAPMEALAAADAVVLFRSGVRQALRRAGYQASFACRPPLPHSVASGWHLHQSLRTADGRNAFARGAAPDAAGHAAGPAAASTRRRGRAAGHPGDASDRGEPGGPTPTPGDAARRVLSDAGVHWLAGLQAHAAGMAALCCPSVDSYSRLQAGAMAPRRAAWGFDHRGAMLRVLGAPGDTATRIENRLPEPMANPYLALAAQVWAGLDGLERALDPGAAGAAGAESTARAEAGDSGPASDPGLLPQTLAAALDALAADNALQAGMGAGLARVFDAVKRHEIARFDGAQDPAAWLRREYFGRC
jgi:glutamine synthetase